MKWGDINGDGKLDLAAVNQTSNNVSILLNTGTGTLGAATNYAAGTTPHAVALKDISEDGHLDLIVTNSGSHNVSVFINTGTGTFNPRVNYAVASTPMRFDLGDINNDGHLDIATSSLGSPNATMLFGDGTGAFGAPSYYAVTTPASDTAALALADLNGDGALDISAATGVGNTVNVALGDGSGGAESQRCSHATRFSGDAPAQRRR